MREVDDFTKNIVFLQLKTLILVQLKHVMTGEKTIVERKAPESKQEDNCSNGSSREADAANAQKSPSGKGKFGAGMAAGFAAAGMAAGTVSAAGVAGYAVGASQPFQEMAREVASDLGFNTSHGPNLSEPLHEQPEEPLEELVPEIATLVDDNVVEEVAVEADAEEGEIDTMVLEEVVDEELVLEEDVAVEEPIMEETLPCVAVEEELAEPSCDSVDDVDMELEDTSVEDISTDPLASNFIDPDIPIDNNMNMSDFI